MVAAIDAAFPGDSESRKAERIGLRNKSAWRDVRSGRRGLSLADIQAVWESGALPAAVFNVFAGWSPPALAQAPSSVQHIPANVRPAAAPAWPDRSRGIYSAARDAIRYSAQLRSVARDVERLAAERRAVADSVRQLVGPAREVQRFAASMRLNLEPFDAVAALL